MSRFSIARLLAPDLFRPLSKTLCPAASAPQWARLFSVSHAARDSWNPPQQPPPPSSPSPSPSPSPIVNVGSQPMERLAKNVLGTALPGGSQTGDSIVDELGISEEAEEESEEPYHFHIYSHKHNTHITVTKPNRDALISLSCGNIGFRKSGRKHYDSAYQLGAYVIDKMHQRGLVKKIHKLEVVLRGFGPGREAVVKVLMGNEGKLLRPKITRVSDATRLKFGGTRSKRIRRLG